MEQKLKLFVWQGFAWDRQDGLAFAIAETEEEAKEMILESIHKYKSDYVVESWGTLEVSDLSKCSHHVLG